ncbi:MAG: InlB B-repeat-containing protein [Gaiellaceae bacterium]
MRLTATAAPGSVFRGWSGACRGHRTCKVTMNVATKVQATFAKLNR